MKLLSAIPNALAQHASLPSGNSGIEQNSQQGQSFQQNFLGFTSPVCRALGLACSGIFLTLGSVLLLFFYWRVNRNGSANYHAVFGLTFSAGIFLFGQWLLFSSLGLLP